MRGGFAQDDRKMYLRKDLLAGGSTLSLDATHEGTHAAGYFHYNPHQGGADQMASSCLPPVIYP